MAYQLADLLGESTRGSQDADHVIGAVMAAAHLQPL